MANLINGLLRIGTQDHPVQIRKPLFPTFGGSLCRGPSGLGIGVKYRYLYYEYCFLRYLYYEYLYISGKLGFAKTEHEAIPERMPCTPGACTWVKAWAHLCMRSKEGRKVGPTEAVPRNLALGPPDPNILWETPGPPSGGVACQARPEIGTRVLCFVIGCPGEAAKEILAVTPSYLGGTSPRIWT